MSAARAAQGRSRSLGKATDPIARELLKQVAASPMTDEEIMERAGVTHHTLGRLRSGSSPRLFVVAALAGALGLDVKLEPATKVNGALTRGGE